MVRNQLVLGLPNRIFEKAMDLKTDATLSETLQACVAAEFRVKATAVMAPLPGPSYVNALHRLGPRPKDRAFSGEGPSHQRGKKSGYKSSECWRCGGRHDAATCGFREATCFKCRGMGHLARRCKNARSVRKVDDSDESSEAASVNKVNENVSMNPIPVQIALRANKI